MLEINYKLNGYYRLLHGGKPIRDKCLNLFNGRVYALLVRFCSFNFCSVFWVKLINIQQVRW